jgi:hypothetical protein
MTEISHIYELAVSCLCFIMQFDLSLTSHPILRNMNLIFTLDSLYFLEFSDYMDIRSFLIKCC